MVLNYARKLARKVGVHAIRYADTTGARHKLILEHHKIDLVFDVGANIGQYAEDLRQNNFSGRIISFEPTGKAFAKLQAAAASDANWECHRLALGSENTTAQMDVAELDFTSSLLPVSSELARMVPGSAAKSTETVEVKTLDGLFDSLIKNAKRPMLKIDAQGYEEEILKGSRNVISRMELVQLEMSLATLYSGEMLMPEMMEFMAELGFKPVWYQPGFSDVKTGYLKQIDCIFAKA